MRHGRTHRGGATESYVLRGWEAASQRRCRIALFNQPLVLLCDGPNFPFESFSTPNGNATDEFFDGTQRTQNYLPVRSDLCALPSGWAVSRGRLHHAYRHLVTSAQVAASPNKGFVFSRASESHASDVKAQAHPA